MVAKQLELERDGVRGDELDLALASFYWENDPRKDSVLVNCWSISPHESYALWKIYLRGEVKGVAVRTTVGALKKAITSEVDDNSENFYIGRVQYSNHLKPDKLNRLSVVTTKKHFYDFEKELRVFILGSEESGAAATDAGISGRTVKIGLQELVHRVYVSPFADGGYWNRVRTLLAAGGIATDKQTRSAIMDS